MGENDQTLGSDDFGEVRDRMDLLSAFLGAVVADHPVFRSRPDLERSRAAAQEALEAIGRQLSAISEPLDECHQVLDRAHLALQFAELALGELSAVRRQPRLVELYDRATGGLGELYQAAPNVLD